MMHALFAAVGILAWMTSHLGSSQCTATADHQLRSGALSELGLLPPGPSTVPWPSWETGSGNDF